MDTIKIFKIPVRNNEYFSYFHTSNLKNLEEMANFPEKYKVTHTSKSNVNMNENFIQEEIENPSDHITISETDLEIKSLTPKRHQTPVAFQGSIGQNIYSPVTFMKSTDLKTLAN